MAVKVNWEGVYPAVTTKFHPDESIDYTSFEKGIDAQINAGVHAIVICGSLGEASTLSGSEKLDLLGSGLNAADGRVPLILNVAEQRTRSAIHMVEAAENLGADGFMLLPPLKYKASSTETVSFFKAVANATPLPVMVYNNPVDYGNEVTIEMFESLIECENIRAVKESTRDVTNVIRLKNAFGDRIKILCGVDTIALECLVTGADGWVAGLVNAFPGETVAIYNHIKSGDIDRALEIYKWFMPLLELDIHPKLVQYIKLAEVATGLGTEFTRAPRMALIGNERDKVETIIREALKKRPQL